MRVLCVGMMVYDTLLSPVPADILKRDSAGIRPPVVSCGGDALNVALGLARLGEHPFVAGRRGMDERGDFIERICEEAGVDTCYIKLDRQYPTAVTYALVDENGERHFLSEKSIFHRLSGKDIPDEAVEKADLVYFGSAMAMKSMDREGIFQLFSRAHRKGKMTVMDAAVDWEDPDQEWMKILDTAFLETDIFFPSLEEAVKLTGEKEPEKIKEHFRKYGMKLFGIKLGAKGCFVTDFASDNYISCPQGLPVVDTTGAGDSFMAGLICAVGKGWDVYDSAGFASCVAAKNIGVCGGSAGVPGFEEAYTFYQGYKNNLYKRKRG